MTTCNRCGKIVSNVEWDIHTCTPWPGLCNECETVAHCLKYGCIPKHRMKTTSNRLALVDVFHHWTPIDPNNPPHLGVKLLIIDKSLGVAVIGNYTKTGSWTHYAGLPSFNREEDA